MSPIIYIFAIIEAIVLTLVLLLVPFFASLDAPGTIVSTISKPPQIVPNTPLPVLKPNKTVAQQKQDYCKKYNHEPVPDISIIQIEEMVLALTNQERKKAGLPSVKLDEGLRKTARIHSRDMIDRDFFDHVSPDGKTPFDRIAIFHRTLIGVGGENIWRGDNIPLIEIATQAMENWMNSPGHRANILRKEFNYLGVGGAQQNNIVTLTQNFASVQAYLKQGVPFCDGYSSLKPGDHLPLTVEPVLQPQAPTRYGFWLSDQGMMEGVSLPITNATINVAPGDYRLRFYFQQPSTDKSVINYVVYNGPQIVVETK